MGKSKGKASKKAEEVVSKCNCDHPYQCSCGKRPLRPSKGHKWDTETQTWGGKGHKQKGASGQTATVGQAEKVTSVGQTAVKQWQKLPTTLLADLIQKDKTLKKGKPVYKPANNGGGKGYRYRLVIPDISKKGSTNSSDHDVVLLPALSVQNEEQAKEEAALLGLLYLFPKLPHERTLPEPYRSTYLAALENSKSSSSSSAVAAKKNKEKDVNNNKAIENIAPLDGINSLSRSDGGATSNTKLMANIPSFTTKTDNQAPGSGPVILTKAQLNEARKEHQRAVQARIRKHEAIRNANKPMEVFMSATFRSRIECLLSGAVFEEMKETDDVESDEDDSEDVVKSYVRQRLVLEGFMMSHVRKAYREVYKKGELSSIADGQDTIMDQAYESVLQYLLVHLKEDQLPIGFDPRGGTLDVISGGSLGKKKSRANDKDSKYFDANILQFATLFGLSPQESHAIFTSEIDSTTSARNVFWKYLCDSALVPPERLFSIDTKEKSTDHDRKRNVESATNECEALAAIFAAEEFSIEKDNNTTLISINIPFGGIKLSLEIHYNNGFYPDLLPEVFLALKDRNINNNQYNQGGTLHLKIVRFLSELSPGQECIFELFGYVQTLLQELDEEDPALLLSKLNSTDRMDSNPIKSPQAPTFENNKQISRVLHKTLRRPREKSSFFCTPPSKTPAAESHPKLSVLMDRARKNLPAFKIRDEFLSVMKEASTNGRVVFVTGETGSGKTTQIPQYILENDPNGSKIIVAQPRRLAATGVATRVALERNELEVGKGSVGYVVRGDSKTCDKTRLLFLTTGVLLRQLQSENALDNISHIVVDEVHERHLDTDVLLAILKKILGSYPTLKVVLMSATMDADRLAAYWSFTKEVPRIHIEGFTYPVTDFFLEDVLCMTKYIPPKNKKKSSQYLRGDKYQLQTSLVDNNFDDKVEDIAENVIEYRPENCAVSMEECLNRFNEKEIDYDLIAALIKTLLRSKDDDGSILCFLPGLGEIDRASNAIQTLLRDCAITIIPLHGGLTPEKQQQVFLPTKKGFTKIILSTNVAETSITIPDTTIVIDTCKEKQSSFDPINRMPLLLERFAARDSLKQRRGRAGRVRPGNCYKLVSSSFYGSLPEHGEPEICRCSLDQTILSLLFLGLEDGTGNFLRLLLDPPSEEAVESAFYSLEKIGALSRNGTLAILTPLGTHLAGIPAPPTVGKLLVMGSLLGCRNISIAVAAGMSIGRSPFLRINYSNHRNNSDLEREEREKEQRQERANLFKTVGNSDHAMFGKAFLLWQSCNGAAERRRFCDRLGLNFNSMREIAQLANQLDSSLTTLGFTASQDSNKNENSWRVIRSVIVSALSPNQIVRVQKPTTKYTETVEGAVAKDGESKELNFFIREGNNVDTNTSDGEGKCRNLNGETRVFIHPCSQNFNVGQYSCPWLVYHHLLQTSKAFICDSTECNAYAMLMFGGTMNVQASKGLIVLDNWIALSANPRIGSLIGRLREKLDDLLEKKVADPSVDITNSTEMAIITDLLKRDGC